jgi:hypothetical protein
MKLARGKNVFLKMRINDFSKHLIKSNEQNYNRATLQELSYCERNIGSSEIKIPIKYLQKIIAYRSDIS